MSFYSLNLASLEASQLDLQKLLTKGGLIVKRTGKSFTGVPVDMYLKQTTNAKSQLRGVIAFSDISKTVGQ